MVELKQYANYKTDMDKTIFDDYQDAYKKMLRTWRHIINSNQYDEKEDDYINIRDSENIINEETYYCDDYARISWSTDGIRQWIQFNIEEVEDHTDEEKGLVLYELCLEANYKDELEKKIFSSEQKARDYLREEWFRIKECDFYDYKYCSICIREKENVVECETELEHDQAVVTWKDGGIKQHVYLSMVEVNYFTKQKRRKEL